MKPRSGSASLAENKLIHLIGLGEVVARLGRSVAECLHRPVQAADGNQLAAFTLHGLFSHAPQTQTTARREGQSSKVREDGSK